MFVIIVTGNDNGIHCRVFGFFKILSFKTNPWKEEVV